MLKGFNKRQTDLGDNDLHKISFTLIKLVHRALQIHF